MRKPRIAHGAVRLGHLDVCARKRPAPGWGRPWCSGSEDHDDDEQEDDNCHDDDGDYPTAARNEAWASMGVRFIGFFLSFD